MSRPRCCLACWPSAGWLYDAPIGVLWRALAQNERRLKLFGFDTDQLKAVAFGVSGLMAGIGGAIYAPQQGIVTPQVIGFGLSADLVIWAAVGGRASLLGPVIGTLAGRLAHRAACATRCRSGKC